MSDFAEEGPLRQTRQWPECKGERLRMTTLSLMVGYCPLFAKLLIL